MNERFKSVRKALKLSQEVFGKRLGVTGAGISKIESGDRNLTEQMIKAVCREFSVDYGWLTTGQGEMFCPTSDEVMDAIDRMLSDESEEAREIFKKLALMDPEDWQIVDDLITSLIKNRQNKKIKPGIPTLIES